MLTILEELRFSGGDINVNVKQAISDFVKPADSYPDYDPNRWCMLKEPAEFVRRLKTALGLVGWLSRGTMLRSPGKIDEERTKQLQHLADWFIKEAKRVSGTTTSSKDSKRKGPGRSTKLSPEELREDAKLYDELQDRIITLPELCREWGISQRRGTLMEDRERKRRTRKKAVKKK